MKFGTQPNNASRRTAKRARAGFTLAEVLAALLFMAIVIPVAVAGLHVAGRAGEVAVRKRDAARLAERILNESIVTTNWGNAVQTGVVQEGDRQYRWTMRNETWSQDAMQLLTIQVAFPVQDQEYFVRMSTLADSSQQGITPQ